MLLGFFHIVIGRLLWAIVLLLGLLIRFLIEYWWITVLVIIGIKVWLAIENRKVEKILQNQSLSQNIVHAPKIISSEDRILRLFKGRNIRLDADYIFKKLHNIPRLDDYLSNLEKSELLKSEIKNNKTYYIITHKGIKQRNKNFWQ